MVQITFVEQPIQIICKVIDQISLLLLNLDYPDLNYLDYLTIQTFFLVPNFS